MSYFSANLPPISFNHSAFLLNGKFIGLALDVKGDENYAKRIDKWVEENKSNF